LGLPSISLVAIPVRRGVSYRCHLDQAVTPRMEIPVVYKLKVPLVIIETQVDGPVTGL
jgi:hypothetical protein